MTDALAVLLHGRRAGTLRLKPNGNLQFRYDESYLMSSGPAVSWSMPLTTDAYPHRTCIAVFGGLLPEQDVRLTVARLRGISATNDFRLLEELGGDCAGAIQFVADQTLDANDMRAPRRIDDDELHRILVDLPRRPLAMGERDGARLSLAGAQAKLPVIVDEGGMALPSGDEPPTTHIIKPEPERFPGLAANEATCMRLARALGLLTANVELGVTNGGSTFLLVQRYDRTIRSGRIARLHQEDACQALARLPSEKYQAEGGPTAAELASLVRAASSAPARDLPRLWDAFVFNYLIGNCDAHGKNFSMLYDARRPSLAPLYDLVATIAYPELSTRLAMTIGGATHIGDVDSAAWVRCANDVQLNARSAMARARELAARAAQVAMRILDATTDADLETTALVTDGVLERAGTLVTRLA